MSNEPAPLPMQGVHMIENVQLETLEKAVYARDYERASRELLTALRRMKMGAQFIGYASDARLQTVLYTRFSAAVVALLSDPGYSLSQEGFDHFAAEHAIMDVIFRASVFDTSDHMLPMLANNPTAADRSQLEIADGAGLVKFLLTYSLRSGFGLSFEETFLRSPQIMFSLWAGMISPLLTVAVQAQDRRELLLGMHGIFKDVKVPDGILATLSDSYMYTTYGLRRDKHDAKATIHAIFARALNERGVKIPGAHVMTSRRSERPRQPYDSEKPTILVCLEWFGSLHAMFRCYAPIIRQLRSKFRIVGMCREQDIDEKGKAEFDEWRAVPSDHLVLNNLVREIVSEVRPDMIYYPSLGMAMWWVMLASVRLAPIQFMTLGHPATSKSPCMDYVICEENAIGDPTLFSERIVEIPTSSARFVMRDDAEGIPFDIPMEEDPMIVRVAVPAMLCKLNASFMGALREITTGEFARPIEIHFFVNMMGVNLFQATKEIRDWIPEGNPMLRAVVHARSGYVDYMMNLRKCHVHLCTFPFGGTNSNIDSMLLGIPVLAMEGDEPHERFDAMMVRHAGLPEWLVAKSREQYVEAARRLIQDATLRNGLSRQLRATDLNGLFFGEPDPDRRTAFLDAVQTIYEEHDGFVKCPGGSFVAKILPRSQS